jgi:hypothetical protein
MSWDDVLLHACSQPCGGTVLGSNVKGESLISALAVYAFLAVSANIPGPCKPIGRTDGVIICWWCSRWLGTFEIWAPPIPPPLHANVYESDDNSVDNFYR